MTVHVKELYDSPVRSPLVDESFKLAEGDLLSGKSRPIWNGVGAQKICHRGDVLVTGSGGSIASCAASLPARR